jgi:serine/threonine protein phosphatase PrpC
MPIRSAAITHIGKVRRQNEDRFLHSDELGLYGIADGIGGLPGGAEAAACTVARIEQAIRALDPATNPDLSQITINANQSVAELGQRISPHFGIGSTLTYGLLRDGKLQLAHVGDSRCYLLRDGQLNCLTLDHSVENDARARQAKGEVVWYNEQQRAALTRCIGQNLPLSVDTSLHPLEPGDRLFFTTDGITRLIREEELTELLSTDAKPNLILQSIVELANIRGGVDNSTAVLVLID